MEKEEHLRAFAKAIKALASSWDYWMDPKVLTILELANALIEEQILLEKVYETERAPNDSFYSEAKEIPSVDDLKQMFED